MLRIARTENGLVEGLPAADPRVTAFKGIPFAAPPVGENRWRPPQRAQDWEGIRKCYAFAPISMQEIPGGDPDNIYTREWHVDSEIPMSEDCLYLNVWTPAKTENEKLPVLVWIFGGAFQCGYTAEMEFDGERIARRGVIAVTVNYRVNVFGFLSHPLLQKEQPDSCWGNYGLLDQRAGIAWVRRNIAHFGGDPENITIGGQSAGAGSVSAHLVSEMTKGYFQKAITQSGGGLRKYGQGSGAVPMEEALDNGVRFFEKLGVKTLEEARSIDAQTLRDEAIAFGGIRTWAPTIDGRYLTADPSDLFYQNRYHNVPILLGNCGNEHERGDKKQPETLADVETYAKANLGKYAADFIRAANVSNDAEAKAFGKSDAVFIGRCVNNLLFLEKREEAERKNAYCYYFNPSYPGWDDPGAFHSSELWFVFETLAKCWRPFTGKHYDLARKVCNYWTNFMKTGDPNGSDADGEPMPRWEPYTRSNPFVLYLSDDGIARCRDLMTDPMKLKMKHIFEEVIDL